MGTSRVWLLVVAPLACCVTVFGRQCGFPGRPRNGSSTTVSPVSRPGDTVHYTCRQGFTLFGEEERVCLDSGIWAGRQPLCELNLALEQTALISATLWNYRATLAVDGNPETCSYTPRTTEQRWWQVDLSTDHHVGSVALIINKDIYQEFTIFVIQLLSKSEALYKPCATFKGRFQTPRILFSCNDGQGHQGRYIYIRDDRRDQDYFALCEVEVFSHRDDTTCGDPEEPVAGLVALSSDNTAIYSCKSGYRLLAEPNRTCERDGHWTGHAPQCEAITCGYPQIYPNSEVQLLNQSTLWNVIVVYSCKEGYSFLTGTTQVAATCLSTGIWESINISCIIDGDRNLPVKLTGKEWSQETNLEDDFKDNDISIPGMISLGIFCSLLIIMLAVLGIFLAKRFQAKKTPQPATPQSANDLIISNTKESVYDDSASAHVTVMSVTAPSQLSGLEKDKTQVNKMLPLFSQGQENSRYDTLQSFPSVSSYNSTVVTDIEDDHNYSRMKKSDIAGGQERIRRPNNSMYESIRLRSASEKAQVDPEYETVRNLQQLAAESTYEGVQGNGLLGSLGKTKGKPLRSIPSALKFFLQPSSKPTESELCDGVIPAEVLALYAQVDKAKKRKYRSNTANGLDNCQIQCSHISSHTEDVCECTKYPISDIARISQESCTPTMWNENAKDCGDMLRECGLVNGRPLPHVPNIRFMQNGKKSLDLKAQTIQCDQL